MAGGGYVSSFTYLLELKLSTASNVGIGIKCGDDAASNGCGIHLAVCPWLKECVPFLEWKLSRGPGRKRRSKILGVHALKMAGHNELCEGTLGTAGPKGP